MKRKDIKIFAQKEMSELEKEAENIRLEIGKLGMDMQLKKVKNVSLISEKKKDLARILTFIREKELSNV